MAETLAQKRARQHNERIAARECIADIEAILRSYSGDEASRIRRRIVEYNQEIVK